MYQINVYNMLSISILMGTGQGKRNNCNFVGNYTNVMYRQLMKFIRVQHSHQCIPFFSHNSLYKMQCYSSLYIHIYTNTQSSSVIHSCSRYIKLSSCVVWWLFRLWSSIKLSINACVCGWYDGARGIERDAKRSIYATQWWFQWAYRMSNCTLFKLYGSYMSSKFCMSLIN